MTRFKPSIFIVVLLLFLNVEVSDAARLTSQHQGQVKLGNVLVPGVSVTAVQGDKKLTAITDAQGMYSFPDFRGFCGRASISPVVVSLYIFNNTILHSLNDCLRLVRYSAKCSQMRRNHEAP